MVGQASAKHFQQYTKPLLRYRGLRALAMTVLPIAVRQKGPPLTHANLLSNGWRTFTMQVEALARKRRKGEQNIKVKHVHVYAGGQAIVGNVSHRGGRGYRKNEQQAYERKKAKPATRAIPDSPAVRSADQEREALPFASDKKGPLSIARRCKR